MALGVPFDHDAFLAGIATAINVGLPPLPGDQPLFVFRDATATVSSTDDEGVPFDPTIAPVITPGLRKRVPCAVEYLDVVGKVVNFGIVTPSQVRLTFLDAQYQMVLGFEYVLIAGDKYLYRRTAPPIGMVTATVWTVYAVAEDER